jgi:hypothetical protein
MEVEMTLLLLLPQQWGPLYCQLVLLHRRQPAV